MNLMSSSKSVYRYDLEGLQDISDICFLRRRTKARQNNKNSFFFSISSEFADKEMLFDFLKEKMTSDDWVLAGPSIFPEVCRQLNTPNCLLKICSMSDLRAANKEFPLLFAPVLKNELVELAKFYREQKQFQIYWSFVPYNPDLLNSITVKDIFQQRIQYKPFPGLEVYNTRIPRHYELEPVPKASYNIRWSFSTPEPAPVVSVIIPTFNNSAFLSNVVWHLINQNYEKNSYEILIADDGSTDNSCEILQDLFQKFKNSVNIKYIYWSKQHPILGEQFFFRSGLARNLASRYSRGKNLVFLDSDMLVPDNFIATCVESLKSSDLIQFQRFHIHQELSKTNPRYTDIQVPKDTYIEEKDYWSELFFCSRWTDLPFYWKYTCTYALGIARDQFFSLGLFKKYYISYGFEDTDIGYEAHKRNFRFSLIKLPLLHLTSYDQMQYKNSFSRRFKLLRVTAELFYLQHLDHDIYSLLGNYYRAQKPLKSYFRDLLS